MASTSSSRPPHSSRLLRELRTALDAEAEQDIELAMRIGVLRAAGHRRHEIPARLGVDAAKLRPAYRLLAGAVRRLDGATSSAALEHMELDG